MGISMDDLKGKNFEQQLGLISDGLARMGSGTERTAASMKLFGRGWQTVVPMMRDGSAAMDENLAAARRYGNVIAGDTLKKQMRLTAETRESKDRKSTRLNSSHLRLSRMPSSA